MTVLIPDPSKECVCGHAEDDHYRFDGENGVVTRCRECAAIAYDLTPDHEFEVKP